MSVVEIAEGIILLQLKNFIFYWENANVAIKVFIWNLCQMLIKVFFGPDPKILYSNKPPLFLLVASIDFFFSPKGTLIVLIEAGQLGFTLKINAMNKKYYTIIL